MPGLVPGTNVFASIKQERKTWMAGTSPAMTKWEKTYAALAAVPHGNPARAMPP